MSRPSTFTIATERSYLSSRSTFTARRRPSTSSARASLADKPASCWRPASSHQGLTEFGGIHAEQPDALAAYLEGVAVDDARMTTVTPPLDAQPLPKSIEQTDRQGGAEQDQRHDRSPFEMVCRGCVDDRSGQANQALGHVQHQGAKRAKPFTDLFHRHGCRHSLSWPRDEASVCPQGPLLSENSRSACPGQRKRPPDLGQSGSTGVVLAKRRRWPTTASVGKLSDRAVSHRALAMHQAVLPIMVFGYRMNKVRRRPTKDVSSCID